MKRGIFVMRRCLIAAMALLGACSTGYADVPELGGTTWVMNSGDPATLDCEVDEIDFAPDGTAAIYYILDDRPDTGTWSLNGTSLKVTYDALPGDISGTLTADRFDAVSTWQSAKTKEVHHDVCIFEPG
jgi:hypothetical protein